MNKLTNIHAVYRPLYGNPGIASTLPTGRRNGAWPPPSRLQMGDRAQKRSLGLLLIDASLK